MTQSKKAPFRIYTTKEIEEFVKDDKLPKELSKEIEQHLICFNDLNQ